MRQTLRRKLLLALPALFALPLAARAQQPDKALIGFLSGRAAGDTANLVASFRKGLGEAGFVEGRNIAIDYRWADGQFDRLPALAADLVHRPGMAILVSTGGDSAALAAKAATSTTPLVFVMGGDPVKSGLVASFGRPGGNATGITMLSTTLEGKRLELFHELLPRASTIGFLLNSNYAPAASQLSDAEGAAHALGFALDVFRANTDREIDAAFESMARRRIHALVISASPFYLARRAQVLALAAKHAIPASYPFPEFVNGGGLMSYGVNLAEVYLQAGTYAGRILKGTKPADLPVLQPTVFELALNAPAARKLGIKIPQSILLRADRVIQ